MYLVIMICPWIVFAFWMTHTIACPINLQYISDERLKQEMEEIDPNLFLYIRYDLDDFHNIKLYNILDFIFLFFVLIETMGNGLLIVSKCSIDVCKYVMIAEELSILVPGFIAIFHLNIKQ